jgi:phage shock protein PspC (stress-responsive transcriptional regulator)
MVNEFYRDKSRGMVAGVCAGLADYFGVSASILRLGFVLLALAGGPGVVLYLILWIILPDKSVVSPQQGETVRDNVRDIGAEARGFGRELSDLLGGKATPDRPASKRVLWLGALLVLIGLVSLAQGLGWLSWFREEMAWALALIIAGGVMLFRALRSR